MSSRSVSAGAVAQPHTLVASTLRDLYTRILLDPALEQRGVLGITSAIDGEGKTTIATGLATTLASDGTLRVAGCQTGTILLLECNPGTPSMSQELGISETPGLMDYLQRDCALEDAIRETEFPRLWVLPCGSRGSNFSVLVRTPLMREGMRRIRERFDFVIMDLPSVLRNSDIQVLAALTDRIVLVVRSGVTPTRLIRRAVGEMGAERLAGAILNAFRPDLPAWLDQLL
jgi:Mrp family chromosome partitioning ATPase